PSLPLSRRPCRHRRNALMPGPEGRQTSYLPRSGKADRLTLYERREKRLGGAAGGERQAPRHGLEPVRREDAPEHRHQVTPSVRSPEAQRDEVRESTRAADD